MAAYKAPPHFKAPPPMQDDLSYADWKKEIAIWRTFTEMDAKRQGAAIFLTLTGKARETVRSDVDEKQLSADDGVDKLITSLDAIFKKDETQTAFSAFDDFIKYRRSTHMKIGDYIAEFNLKYNKIKLNAMTLPEGVLAYTLLTCANLSDEQQQLCRATVANLTYIDMKKTIEKVVNSIGSDEGKIKDYALYAQYEQSDFTDYSQDVYHTYDPTSQYELSEEINEDIDGAQAEFAENTYYAQYNNYRGRGYNQANRPRGYSPRDNRGRDYSRPNMRGTNTNQNRPALNPVDQYGKPMPCNFCHSVYHWIDKCPHAPETVQSGRGRAWSSRGRSFRRPGYGGTPPWKQI